MSPGDEATPEDATYVRGVAVGSVGSRDAGPAIRVVAAGVVLALIGLTIALTVSAASENSHRNALRHQGVPVPATVTGCQGISSGVGMGIEYWACRASYTLGGHSYDELIKGSRDLLQPGQTVVAIAIPGEPGLSAAATATAKYSNWTPYITPIILAGLTLAMVVGLWWWSRRRRGRDRAQDSVSRSVSV